MPISATIINPMFTSRTSPRSHHCGRGRYHHHHLLSLVGHHTPAARLYLLWLPVPESSRRHGCEDQDRQPRPVLSVINNKAKMKQAERYQRQAHALGKAGNSVVPRPHWICQLSIPEDRLLQPSTKTTRFRDRA